MTSKRIILGIDAKIGVVTAEEVPADWIVVTTEDGWHIIRKDSSRIFMTYGQLAAIWRDVERKFTQNP